MPPPVKKIKTASKITVMYWNIQNFGVAKYTKGAGNEIVELMTDVIEHEKADIVAMNELRSTLGDTIGKKLAATLRNKGRRLTWAKQESQGFSTGRGEQYVFLWNTDAIVLNPALNSTVPSAFQDEFYYPPPGANAGNKIGFPNLGDRPPYLGYFQTKQRQIDILVAAYHAPGPRVPAVRGNRNLAAVAEFKTKGNICLIMGDTNIPKPNDWHLQGNWGQKAWASPIALPHLCGPNGQFEQRLLGELSSLISYKSAKTVTTYLSCYSQPYDQIFVRPKAPIGALRTTHPRRLELISECATGYLRNALKAVQTKRELSAPNQYNNQTAFAAFAHWVSDHTPVAVDVEW